MLHRLSAREAVLLAAVLGLLALAACGLPLAQDPAFHGFADRRPWLGIPNAADVLSNLPFALAAVWGLRLLQRLPAGALDGAQRAMAALFFAGLGLTAAGSAWYHWAPDQAGLAVDRACMAVAFAGLLGLAVADRVGARAGWATGLVLLPAGLASIAVWLHDGNLLPWACLQGGGIVLLLWLGLLAPPAAALRVRWLWVIAAYAAAKLAEQADHALFAHGGWLSGHTLKHLLASLAALPVLAALTRRLGAAAVSRQNPAPARQAAFALPTAETGASHGR